MDDSEDDKIERENRKGFLVSRLSQVEQEMAAAEQAGDADKAMSLRSQRDQVMAEIGSLS